METSARNLYVLITILITVSVRAPSILAESNQGCSSGLTATTKLYQRYTFVPYKLNPDKVEFSVRASCDVHIALSGSPNTKSIAYEIILGAQHNKKSSISTCTDCKEKVLVDTPSIVTSCEFRSFWISYDSDKGTLSVGKGGESNAFLTWTDPDPRTKSDVQHVGFDTGYGETGEFKFCIPECNAGISAWTGPVKKYQFFPDPVNMKEIRFSVRAKSDVLIALGTKPDTSSGYYEATIDRYSRRVSWGRCQPGRSCQSKVAIGGGAELTPGDFTAFRITYNAQKAEMELWKEGATRRSLGHRDYLARKTPLDIKYLGYTTDRGSEGEFFFCFKKTDKTATVG